MTPHPGLSAASIELVKRFEGLRLTAARLEDGGWTIGYGHTASAREGAAVTADQAEMLLTYDLDRVARAIDPLIFTPLNPNQFNALVAFAFNIGVDGFRASSVLKRINEGACLEAAAAIELWRRAPFEGEALVIDGLVRRRAAEKLLFLTPPDGFRPVPTPVVRAAYDAAAGPRRPVELRVSLDGDRAVAERSVEDAAEELAVRLRQLFPETDPEPIVAAMASAPALEPQPLTESPAPQPAAETPADEPPPPPFAAAPVHRLFEPPRRAPALEDMIEDILPSPHQAEPATAFGRRYGSETPSEAAREPRRPLAPLAAGAAGAVLFVGALATMVLGKATLTNLVVGLIGVALMTPAALRILIRLLGERANSP